jgi:hypothetical protein
MMEVVHDVRVVRIGGRHIPPEIRLWMGDSIGRWEGGTLVIDTANFKGHLQANGTSAGMHLSERLTPVDANTLLYRATIDDPAMFTKSWTVEFPLTRYPQRLFEYACHEGNYSIGAILAGARGWKP